MSEVKGIGIYSEDLKKDLLKSKTVEDVFKENLKKLQKHQRDKSILWGRVLGIIERKSTMSGIFVEVEWNNCLVLIPEEYYYPLNFNYKRVSNSYDKKTSSEQRILRKAYLRHQIEAVVPFVVLKTRNNATEYLEENINIHAIASRSDALEVLKDIYFFHKNRTLIDGEPRSVNIGDFVEARVIGVKEANVYVEALGVETVINAFDISNDYVTNCNDVVEVGDVIKVKVKKLKIDKTDIYLALTRRFDTVENLPDFIKEGDLFFGTIKQVSDDKYIASLDLGISASIKKKNVTGKMELSIGDRVRVKITKVFNTYVYAIATRV